MFQLNLGTSREYCDGLHRRSFLQLGIAGLASVGLPQLLAAKDRANATSKKTSVILLWLDGGPGHMDMYDMKPDAPAEYRGIWKPINTNVSGLQITELYPLQAKVADKFSIVRSLHHGTGDHFAAGHRMLTTKEMGVGGNATPQKFPGIGSIVNREVGARQPGMPGYVGIPYGMSIGLRPGYFGGHMLGTQHNPFETGGDPNAAKFTVQNLNLANGLSVDKLDDRRALSQRFDQTRKDLTPLVESEAMDRFEKQAFEFVTGERARKAFDLSGEDAKLRDRYGRHTWGQSALLARRLVEAGSTFVTIHLGGWDHHWDLKKGYENYLPKVDSAVATLFSDLAERGLLDTTLVMVCGEFSRTPKMNDGGNGGAPMSQGTPGRDHWGNAMFCLLGGGGVKGGQVVDDLPRLGHGPHVASCRPNRPTDASPRRPPADPRTAVSVGHRRSQPANVRTIRI
jgi:Protein of unknown function (DUF1501)